jgi:iron complex outermembrane recepter protein
MNVLAHRHMTASLSGCCTSVAAMAASITCMVGTAQAAPADGGEKVVEEVLVTAQRRTERLIDTPLSIGVLSGAELDQSSVRGVTDVLNQVGGVSLTEAQPGNVQIAVRGVLSSASAGTSSVGYYNDEVPFAFINTAELPDTNAFDLARVEVLRGPQGTLYGANALNGVVRVLTNDADVNAFEAKGRLRGSQTHRGGDNYNGDVALNVPIVPGKLAIRAVAGYSDLSGFIDSTFDGGKDFNDTQAQSYRLKVNYQPSDEFNVKLGYTRSEIDNGGPSSAQDNFTTRFSSNQPDERVLDIYNLIAEYRAPKVSLLSSTGYVDYLGHRRVELLFGGVSLLPVLYTSGLTSFSQEVRLSSNLEGPWRWTAGALYKDTTESTLQDPQAIIPGNLSADYISESYAVFGEATRSFAERFEFTAGVRYFEDRFKVVQYSAFAGAAAPPQKATFDKVTWRALLTYRPQADAMLYGSVATGFRSGRNQSFAALNFDPTLPAVEPDSLITYEVGTKNELAGGALTFETIVYYTKWEDIQQSLVIPQGFLGYLNAGEASGVGADASIVVRPTHSLSFQASIGWNDLKLDEDVRQGTAILFQKGARVNDSPEWTGSLGASFRTGMPMENVDFVLSSNYAYGSDRLSRYISAGSGLQTESDAIGNLKASAGLAGERWTVDLYGDNLTNEDGSITSPNGGEAFNSLRYRPRTVGLQTTFSF